MRRMLENNINISSKRQSPKGEKGVRVNLCVDVNLCEFYETPSPSSFARAVQKMSRYML